MKKYGLVKLAEEDEISILCSWNENFINRLVNDATNTDYIKPVRDMVTDEIIKPNPIVFWDGESTNVKEPKRLTYVTCPEPISEEEAMKYLKSLKEDSQKLTEYVDYISAKKNLVHSNKKR